MPRCYFHLTDGKQVLNNHKGIDLSGNGAAREEALALARDLKHGAVMPGWNWTGWFVASVDQHGHMVEEVPIADASQGQSKLASTKLMTLNQQTE
jgi:hypothetical protein